MTEIDLRCLSPPWILLDGEHVQPRLGKRASVDAQAASDVRDCAVRGLRVVQALSHSGGAVAGDVPAGGLLEGLVLQDHLPGPGPEAVLGSALQAQLGGEGGDQVRISLGVGSPHAGEGTGIGGIRQAGEGLPEGSCLDRDEVAGLGPGHEGRLALRGGDLALGLTEC